MSVNQVILELMVHNVDETIDFYQNALDFELEACEKDGDDRTYWAKMSYNGFMISFKEAERLKDEVVFMRDVSVGSSTALCIQLGEDESLESYYQELETKFRLLDHPHLTPCGATQFSMRDNNGYVLTFEKF